MDDEVTKTKSTTIIKDELDVYIDFTVDKDKDYSNSLSFLQENEKLFRTFIKVSMSYILNTM
jgi:hypothetical protein